MLGALGSGWFAFQARVICQGFGYRFSSHIRKLRVCSDMAGVPWLS